MGKLDTDKNNGNAIGLSADDKRLYTFRKIMGIVIIISITIFMFINR